MMPPNAPPAATRVRALDIDRLAPDRHGRTARRVLETDAHGKPLLTTFDDR